MDSLPSSNSKKRARTDDDDNNDDDSDISAFLTPFDKKILFDKVYGGSYLLDGDNDLFKKSYQELKDEKTIYGAYMSKLQKKESEIKAREAKIKAREAKIKAREAKIKAKEAEIKAKELQTQFEAAKDLFLIKTRADNSCTDTNYIEFISNVCAALDYDLINLVKNNLNEKLKVKIARKITECGVGKNLSFCHKLLKIYGLNNVDFRNCIIPRNMEGNPHLPWTMKASTQKKAAEENNYHVFPYPHEVPEQFPVLFCHPVFATFADIVHDRIDKESQTFKDYEITINDDIRIKIDNCVSQLVHAILKSADERNENEVSFVKDVVSALKKLFPEHDVRKEVKIAPGTNVTTATKATNVTTATKATNASATNASTATKAVNIGDNITSSPPRMDAIVQIKKFPYILLEAKKNNYSINAVLQGLQYYGLSEDGYIDNDPCFLITIDKGIMFIYGVAVVCRRVVCSCLLSLEFTSFFFNIEGFMEKLWKSCAALYFFYSEFKSRIQNISNDPQHSKYSAFKAEITFNDQPYPAIFNVRAKGDPTKRIDIKIEKIVREDESDKLEEAASFKPCVYLVKTSDKDYAVLKLARNYDIEAHEKMAADGMAPKIIGHETLCGGQYQIILMEYLDKSYDTLYDYIEKYGISDSDKIVIVEELGKIIKKLRELRLVHGDFRSSNIVVKRSSDDPEKFDFKLIDFEYSGEVGTQYPNLSFLNRRKIEWPEGLNSYCQRTFDHDLFMFEKIKENELNL